MTITLEDLEKQKEISDRHENDPALSHEQRQYWISIGNKVRNLMQALKDNQCANCGNEITGHAKVCQTSFK